MRLALISLLMIPLAVGCWLLAVGCGSKEDTGTVTDADSDLSDAEIEAVIAYLR